MKNRIVSIQSCIDCRLLAIAVCHEKIFREGKKKQPDLAAIHELKREEILHQQTADRLRRMLPHQREIKILL